MKFRLIVALVSEDLTEAIMKAAREAGATGCTVISNARGEGLKQAKTFFGLTLHGTRNVVLTLVERHLGRHILEIVSAAGRFEEEPGSGIAIMLDVLDAVGLTSQVGAIKSEIQEKI